MKLVEMMTWAHANLLQMELIEMMMMVGETFGLYVVGWDRTD